MNVAPIWKLAAIKAIARDSSQMIEAHGALLVAHGKAFDDANNEALPVRERRAAFFRLGALSFCLELPFELTMENFRIPEEEEEPLTAEQRGLAWELCAAYERQIREGDPTLRAQSFAHLTQIYEDFGLTGPTMETILNSAPKVPDAACAPLEGGAA